MTIPRETLREILLTMLKDTLVPMATYINELCAALEGMGAVEESENLRSKTLSDAVILACVRDWVAQNGRDRGKGSPVVKLHHRHIFFTLCDDTPVLCIGAVSIPYNQLCAEVRAALLGESDE